MFNAVTTVVAYQVFFSSNFQLIHDNIPSHNAMMHNTPSLLSMIDKEIIQISIIHDNYCKLIHDDVIRIITTVLLIKK